MPEPARHEGGVGQKQGDAEPEVGGERDQAGDEQRQEQAAGDGADVVHDSNWFTHLNRFVKNIPNFYDACGKIRFLLER